MRAHRVLLATGVVVLAADWCSKLLASHYLTGRDIELGAGLALRLGHNSGVAFGLGAGSPPFLLTALTLTVAVVIAVAAWRGLFESPIAAGLVVGGAVANVADRTLGGSVVDMIDVGRWPTFNLADVAINAGVLLAVVTSFRRNSADERLQAD